MAGASGGSADLLVSLSIFACILLLASATLRRLAANAGWERRRLRAIEISLRWSPLALFALLWLTYAADHLSLDLGSVHVSRNLNAESSLLDRLLAMFAGADGAMLLMLTTVAVVHVLLRRISSAALESDVLDRWFALLWLSSLAMLLPPEMFASLGGAGPAPLARAEMILSSLSSISTIPIGIVLGAAPHALTASNRGLNPLITIHAVLALLLLMVNDWSVLFPVSLAAGSTWPAQMLSLPESDRLAGFVTIWVVFACSPMLMAQATRLDSQWSAGRRRWLGLGSGIGLSLLALIASAWLALHPGWSTPTIAQTLLVELFPLLFFASAFCLLPVMGMDERARPELHGWRLGLLVGLLAAGLVGRPASLAMSGGWLLALLIATWVPLAIETQPAMSRAERCIAMLVPLAGVVLLLAIPSEGMGMKIPLIALSVLVLLSSTSKGLLFGARGDDGEE